jgi:hypothetical protein
MSFWWETVIANRKVSHQTWHDSIFLMLLKMEMLLALRFFHKTLAV